MEDKPVVGWCTYCKEEIYAGEAFVVVEYKMYHACETDEHDNCFNLIKEEEE